jgi:hypothetical protein
MDISAFQIDGAICTCTDCNATCEVGGGSDVLLCHWNGSSWVDALAGDGAMEDGSEGVPSLYYRDDVNTGIYSPGDNIIALTAAGNRHLVVDGHATTGYVGLYPGPDTDEGSWTLGVDGVITKRIQGSKTTSVYLGDYTYVNTTGTVAAGYGTIERIFMENAAGANEIAYQVNYTWTDVTADNEDLDTRWYSMQDGEEEWYMHRSGSTGAVSIADYAPGNSSRGAVLRLFSLLETDYDSTSNVDSGFGGYIEFVSTDDDDVTSSTAFIRWDYDDATAGAEDVDMSFEVYEEGGPTTFFSFLGDAVQADVDEAAVDIETPVITGFKPGVVFTSYGWLHDNDETVNLVPVVPANHIVFAVSTTVVTGFDACAGDIVAVGTSGDPFSIGYNLAAPSTPSTGHCTIDDCKSPGVSGSLLGDFQAPSVQYQASIQPSGCTGPVTVGSAIVVIQWTLVTAEP